MTVFHFLLSTMHSIFALICSSASSVSLSPLNLIYKPYIVHVYANKAHCKDSVKCNCKLIVMVIF